MNTKNPIDVINILGCSNLAGLNHSYESRMKVVGGVGLAIGFLHLFALLCCIVFCFCFNTVRGLSPVNAIKGESPLDEPSSGRRGSSALTTPRPSRRHTLHASKEKLHEGDDGDEIPPNAYKNLRDKSKTWNIGEQNHLSCLWDQSAHVFNLARGPAMGFWFSLLVQVSVVNWWNRDWTMQVVFGGLENRGDAKV